MPTIEYVKRLRDSRKAQPQKDRESGYQAGVKWAQEHADWRELERAAYWRVQENFEKDVDYRWFLIAIDPAAAKYTPGDARCALHDMVFVDCWPDPNFPAFEKEYMHGFWVGAVAVYEEVKARLEKKSRAKA